MDRRFGIKLTLRPIIAVRVSLCNERPPNVDCVARTIPCLWENDVFFAPLIR